MSSQDKTARSVTRVRYDVGGKETWFDLPRQILTITEDGEPFADSGNLSVTESVTPYETAEQA